VTGGDATDATSATLTVEKGVSDTLKYQLKTHREVDTNTVKMTVTGALTIKNNNAAPVNPGDPSGQLRITGITLNAVAATGGATTLVTSSCLSFPITVAPGETTKCTFTKAPFQGYPSDGTIQATVSYEDLSVDPFTTATLQPPAAGTVSDAFDFNSVSGQFANALLTDKFELGPLDNLYTGFSGFSRESVWRYVDASTQVPTAGILITEADVTKE